MIYNYSKGRSLFHWRKANHLFRMQTMIDGKHLKFACIAVFTSAQEAKKKNKKETTLGEVKTFHLFFSQVVNQELSCVPTQVAS